MILVRMAAPRDATTFEVRDALAQPGCPICSLVLRSVGRFLESLAYERVNDVEMRADLRAARGFCNPHAYRWLREARNVLGTALIYRDLINAAVRDLEAAADRSRPGLFDRLMGRGSDPARPAICPACRAQQDAEERYLGALSELLSHADEAHALAASDGLCATHLEAAIRRGGSAADLLVDQTVQRARRLMATLDEVIRKEDYRFRHEPRSGPERSAPSDAIAWVCGADGLVHT
jgi:hypothetical protein